MEEISSVMEGNEASWPMVATLGGLLFSTDPFEKWVNCERLLAVGVEFGLGCIEARGPALVWPQSAIGDNCHA